jgi:DNA-binding transcriptional LysR family regulator
MMRRQGAGQYFVAIVLIAAGYRAPPITAAYRLDACGSLSRRTRLRYGRPMEMNQIRYFLAVARELHFTRAAAACNVSQPALTKAIQKLEEELGGLLFIRDRATTQLTELGRLTVPPLERAWNAAREAKEQAETFRSRASSPLRIGIELSIATLLLRPALNAISRHCADIDLSLSQDGHAEISAAILAGELDVAVLVETETLSERLHRWPLFSERYVIAFPDDHPFCKRESIDVHELEAECLLLSRRADCPARCSLLALMKQNNVRARRERLVGTHEQMMELMLASLGVGVAGEQMPLPASVAARPLTPDPGPRRVMLAVPAGRPLGPTPGIFVKLMRARAWPPPVMPVAGAPA